MCYRASGPNSIVRPQGGNTSPGAGLSPAVAVRRVMGDIPTSVPCVCGICLGRDGQLVNREIHIVDAQLLDSHGYCYVHTCRVS